MWDISIICIKTIVARCTCKIKSRITVAKAEFDEKKNLFSSKLDLNIGKKQVKY